MMEAAVVLPDAPSKLRAANRLLVLAVAVVGVANFLWGEILPVRGGFGWDGLTYRSIALEFPDIVLNKGLFAYYVARIAPSAAVHYGLALFHFPLEDRYILAGFRLYNLLLLVVTAYVWGLITDQLHLGLRQKCLAFAGLFLSFSVAKKVFYTPVETDPTAIFLGTSLLFYYLRSSALGVLGVTLVGAFTWPIMLYYGLLLYVFPRWKSRPLNSDASTVLGRIAALACAGLAVFGFIVFYFVRKNYGYTFSPINHSLAYLSIAIAIVYVFFGVRALLDHYSLRDVSEIIKTLGWGRLLIAAAIFLGIGEFTSFFGQPNPEYLQASIYLPSHLLMSAIQQPAVFWVAHVVFFGPIIFLTLLRWDAVCRTVQQNGVGLVAFFLMNLLLSLASQSRFVLAAFPFVVAFTVKASEDLAWKPAHIWLLCTLSLLFSKVWLTINQAPWTEDSPLLEIPAQLLFMNIGPWMSPTMYAVQGSAVLLAGLMSNALVRNVRKAEPEQNSAGG